MMEWLLPPRHDEKGCCIPILTICCLVTWLDSRPRLIIGSFATAEEAAKIYAKAHFVIQNNRSLLDVQLKKAKHVTKTKNDTDHWVVSI